jgi:hypothetical protein
MQIWIKRIEKKLGRLIWNTRFYRNVLVTFQDESDCDVTATSRNNGTRATRPLLSNDSEITFSLQPIAANESLPGNTLLNTRIPWQPLGNRGQLTVLRGVFYAGRLAVIKSSGFVNPRRTREESVEIRTKED